MHACIYTAPILYRRTITCNKHGAYIYTPYVHACIHTHTPTYTHTLFFTCTHTCMHIYCFCLLQEDDSMQQKWYERSQDLVKKERMIDEKIPELTTLQVQFEHACVLVYVSMCLIMKLSMCVCVFML
jgi:hypothetical protein